MPLCSTLVTSCWNLDDPQQRAEDLLVCVIGSAIGNIGSAIGHLETTEGT